MTRSTLFDRLNHELESFGRKAQKALDEGRLKIELLRVRRQRDQAAQNLGFLVYWREREGAGDPAATPEQLEPLLRRLDRLTAEVHGLEQQIADVRRGAAGAAGATADDAPGGAPGRPVEPLI